MDIRTLILNEEPIYLGYSGENGVTEYKVPFGDWAEEFGEGMLSINHRRPGDESPYPVTFTIEEHIATWVVSDTDTQYSGQGRLQITYTVGNVVKKSLIGNTQIEASLGENMAAPDPWMSYIDTVAALKDSAYESMIGAQDAEAGAREQAQSILDLTATASVSNTVGIPNVDVAVTQDGDHKNMDFAFTNLKGETGDVNFCTFEIDENGHLIATWTRENTEIVFSLNNNGHLEVAI
jgi:hypothetical protein